MYKPKDSYFYKAKREGYPARSVYKLEEIDRKYHLVKKGARILDLGSSPGSWLKYCLKKIGDNGFIVAVDLEEPSFSLPPSVSFIKGDIFKIGIDKIKEKVSSFDLVLSDMAPYTTGIKEVDQSRAFALAEHAIEIGKHLLRKGGAILVKLFESVETVNLRKKLISIFARVNIERPQATRKGSSEIFLLGLGYSKACRRGKGV